jgi:hypothetical protein
MRDVPTLPHCRPVPTSPWAVGSGLEMYEKTKPVLWNDILDGRVTFVQIIMENQNTRNTQLRICEWFQNKQIAETVFYFVQMHRQRNERAADFRLFTIPHGITPQQALSDRKQMKEFKPHDTISSQIPHNLSSPQNPHPLQNAYPRLVLIAFENKGCHWDPEQQQRSTGE